MGEKEIFGQGKGSQKEKEPGHNGINDFKGSWFHHPLKFISNSSHNHEVDKTAPAAGKTEKERLNSRVTDQAMGGDKGGHRKPENG